MKRAICTRPRFFSQGKLNIHQQKRTSRLYWLGTAFADRDPQSTVTVQTAPEEDPKRSRSTGVLHSLPHVSPPDELINSALKRSKRVNRNRKLIGPAAQARNLAARQMDTLMQELTKPLTRYLKGFPLTDRLHKFEAALLDLTITEKRYFKVLQKIQELRKTMTEVGKNYASRGAKADNKKEAERIAEEGFSTMQAIFMKHKGLLLDLIDIVRQLRKLPKLELEVPTVALVGAPNVGKSSLVQAISSGKPEICNYPFTTRSIKMGHFYVDQIRHQVTDTPGLLNRNLEDRNALELLTIATLQYLPTSVVFMMDATEECGMSFPDQLQIRNDLKSSFPEKPWIDVFSKFDLLKDSPVFMSKTESVREALKVSCLSQEGIEEFKAAMIELCSTKES
eukprot:g529.t1